MTAFDVLIIITATIVETRGDAEENATPFIVDTLGLVQHLRHLSLVLSVDLDHASQLWVFLQEVRVNMQCLNHRHDLLNDFYAGERSIG